jgi:hypothetical protein
MPVSAWLQSALFVILAAVALFASAGTVAILGFWLYVSIFAAVILASLLALDPGLLRERMRPGNTRPPGCSPSFSLCIGSSPGSTVVACTGVTAFRRGSRALA